MGIQSHKWRTCSALMVLALLCAPQATEAAPATPPPKKRRLEEHIPLRLVCPPGARQLRFRKVGGLETFCARVVAKHVNRHGLYRSWHPNGKLREYGQYKEGLKVGQWQQWYENGERRAVFTVTRGKLHGRFKQWYASGKPAQAGRFRYGRRVGCWRTWHPSGKVREIYCYTGPRAGTGSKKRVGKFMRNVGIGLTLSAVGLLAGVPMWVAGSVRYRVNNPALTPVARERLRKRFLYAGVAVTLSGLALAGIGGGLLKKGIDEQFNPEKSTPLWVSGAFSIAVGLFASLFVGIPLWAEAARWPPESGPRTAQLDPDIRKLARWTSQQALDPGHEHGFRRRLLAGQPRPTVFTAQLVF